MIDFFMSGLLHLQGVPQLQGIQVAWQVIRGRARAAFGHNISVYIESTERKCDDTFDLVSSIGPPRSLFFSQLLEVAHIRGCLQRLLSPQDCRQRFEEKLHVQEVERSPLNFTYDWPPEACMNSSLLSQRDQTAGACVAHSHATTFGAANLIGDPKKWDVLSSNRTPGYDWASISPDFKCSVRDGWLDSR